MTSHTEHSADPVAIDQLTGGAITASTAQARTQLIKTWLESSPAPSYEQMNDVFKLLSAKDKGAARQIRDCMEEIKKAQTQEMLTALWADKANVLLSTNKLNIADAMAWQRDAAKEGAPISKEPLASLRGALADRVKTIEDIQHRAQVLREAAVLLAQRIEVLSTKYWEEAQSLEGVLSADVERWRTEQNALLIQKDWSSVDPKYTPALQSSAEHLKLVWEAFSEALKQAALSAQDPSQALPAVPAWADQIKHKRSELTGSEAKSHEGQAQQSKKKVEIDPVLKAQGKQAMQQCMGVLEKELAEGHGKASAGAAANLRQALKEYGPVIDQRMERHAQSLLLAAGELEGWQRWRADQIRSELVVKAEGLLQRVKPSVEIKGSKAGHKKTDRQKTEALTLDAAHSTSTTSKENSGVFEQSSELQITPHQTSLGEGEGSSESDKVKQADSHELSNQHLNDLVQEKSVVHVVVKEDTSHQTQSILSAVNGGLDSDLARDSEGSSADETPGLDAASAAFVEKNKNKPNPDYVPTMGPRKLQETLRKLREDWKQTDQGGVPNHALWKRFDNACNLAYPFVHEWLQQTRAQSQEHKAQRLQLIADVKAWAEVHSKGPDWRAVQRQLHEFSEKWRTCGHVSEKVFAELQALWKEAIHLAHLPIDTLQSESIARRKALIAESKILGAQPTLKIEPIKALQQRWQDESHVVPIDRKLAQRLWDEFKKPLDEAFQRKSAERAQVAHSMSAHDELVLKASHALDQAVQEADASKIKIAMQHLQEVTLKGEEAVKLQEVTAPTHAFVPSAVNSPASELQQNDREQVDASQLAHNPDNSTTSPPLTSPSASEGASPPTSGDAGDSVTLEPDTSVAPPPPAQPKPPKLVVAVRGDDRPGAKRTDSRAIPDSRGRAGPGSTRGGKDLRDSRGPRDAKAATPRAGQFPQGRDFKDSRDVREPRGPRLGDAAFRAQRQALEAAESAMRKLAAQAHGQTLTNLMSAWKDKNPDLVPPLKELGSRINANQRVSWTKAIQTGTDKANHEALLRLEMAANAPTPASDLQARRNLQLQLLTKRNDPAPSQTWAEDTATVLSGPYDGEVASRLQTVLKTMLKH